MVKLFNIKEILVTLTLALVMALTLPIGVMAQQGEIIAVRASDTGNLSRLTFYFRSDVAYQASVEGDQFTMTFADPIFFDFGAFTTSPLNNIANPVVQTLDEGGTQLVLNLVGNAITRDYKNGNQLIVEASPPPPVPTGAQMPTGTGAAETNTDNADNDVADSEDDATSAEPQPNQTQPVNANTVSQQPPVTNPAANQANNQTTAAPNAESGNIPILDTRVRANGDQFTMEFTWRYSVSAAVFVRANHLWVIFDEVVNTDLLVVQPYLNNQILTAQQATGPDQTIFRFGLNEGVDASVAKDGNTWIVTLSPNAPAPTSAIALARQETADKSFRIFIPLDDPGPHLRIEDPDVGDILDVIPVRDAGIGTTISRSFVQFQVLKSAQGLVVARSSDDVVVTRFSNGVAVGSVQQLAVSDSPLDNELALRRAGSERDLVPSRLVDFEAWKLGPLQDYYKNLQELLKATSYADPKSLNDRRWDLARFLLGHKMATESLAVLELMAEDDPELLTDPKYRAIRGLALIYNQDYEGASRQIAARELDAEPDIYLWRSLVAEALGNHVQALDLFERGRESLQFYDNEKVATFRLAIVRAALEENRFDTANWQLSLLRRAPLTRFNKSEVDYLEGLLLEKMGETEEAMAYYMAVDDFVNRRAAARARYAIALSRMNRGEIPVDEAILEMERLRYSWRGDRFEQELLHALGVLYLDKGEHRRGLEILRQAVASFPDNPETRAMAGEMVDRFRELFLGGLADEMPPVTALALYYDFRELTPLGQEGDQMIRRLADRLVSVDLLGRASELLVHQVRFRLEGAAQSVIATRLAKIYIMDQKPEKAMEIIRATRQDDIPEDIRNERRLVEARALTQLERYEEADVLLEGINSQEADQLRVDIYWGSQDWSRVVDVTQNILGNRYENSDPLTEMERQYLIRRVIALSLSGRQAELRVAKDRYQSLMQEGLLANAFDVITSPESYSTEEIRDAVRVTASVENFQSFMNSYRQEFVNGGTNSQ